MPANRNAPEVFKQPADLNAQLWRYMDFAKYVSMLERRALFFARADRLGDPFEGAISPLNKRERKKSGDDSAILLSERGTVTMSTPRSYSAINKTMREWTYINCWHLNEVESAAMWRLYAQTSQAIAIQSTYHKLSQALPNAASLGVVQYIDYQKTALPTDQLLHMYLHKRRSFQHEREVRAIILGWNSDEGELRLFTRNPRSGIEVLVDLNAVIERIYVAPAAPAWFRELVGQVSKRYGLDRDVVASSLDDRPIY
jgi:hypothetical protein